MNPQCIDVGTLRAYADGALSSHDAGNVEAHLADCASCRSALSELQAVASQVSSLLVPYLQVGQAAAEDAFAKAKAGLPVKVTGSKSAPQLSPAMAASRPVALRPRRTLPVVAGVGLGLAATLVVAFWLTGFFSSLLQGSLAGLSKGDFVPAGKVRHLVYTHYSEYTTMDVSAPAPVQAQEDVWLANGKDHLLMSRTVSDKPDDWIVVNDEGVFSYNDHGTWALQGAQGFGPSNEPAILKTPYDRRYMSWYLPGSNDILGLLQRPDLTPLDGGKVGGRDTLVYEALDNMEAYSSVLPTGGRSTVVRVTMPPQFFSEQVGTWGSPIGYNSDGTPQPKPSETPTVNMVYSPRWIWSTRQDYRVWLDKETNQVLKQQYVVRQTGDGEEGNTYTETVTLKEVGLVDMESVPSDLFSVKLMAGAASVDAEVVFVPGILPSSGYVKPARGPDISSNWYQTTWNQGGFSYLQPRDTNSEQSNDEWHRRGVFYDGIEYIAGYRDYETIAAGTVDSWLDQLIPEFAATMGGVVLTSHPTELPYTNPNSSGPVMNRIDRIFGRELTIQRRDGRWTLVRVYVMGQRFYFLYVTGPNLESLSIERTDQFLNSFTITTPPEKLPVVGNIAPDFELNDALTYQSVTLSGLRGKPVVLTFTSRECTPCNTAYTELAKLYSIDKNDVAFLSVISGINESPDTLRTYLEANRFYQWPVLMDLNMPSSQVMDTYGVNTFPAAFFIDRDGVIRDVAIGSSVNATAFEQGLSKIR